MSAAEGSGGLERFVFGISDSRPEVDARTWRTILGTCWAASQRRSSASGRRRLELNQHGANLVLLGGEFVEAVQQQGLRVGGPGSRGLNADGCGIGGLGAWIAASGDEPCCHGGAHRSDQSDAHDHDGRGDEHGPRA